MKRIKSYIIGIFIIIFMFAHIGCSSDSSDFTIPNGTYYRVEGLVGLGVDGFNDDKTELGGRGFVVNGDSLRVIVGFFADAGASITFTYEISENEIILTTKSANTVNITVGEITVLTYRVEGDSYFIGDSEYKKLN